MMNRDGNRSVPVVAMGIVSPAGVGVDGFWAGLCSGKSFAQSYETDKDDPHYKTVDQYVACPVPDNGWLDALDPKEARRLDRIAHLALSASDQAIEEAGPLWSETAPARRSIVCGIGFGGISMLTDNHIGFVEKGWKRLPPFGIAAVMPSSAASWLSIRHGVGGVVSTVSSACASGTQAISEGVRLIRSGEADVVLAGGAEAPIHRYPLAGFRRMSAMSTRFDAPTRASRPFDVDRDGFVMGEGAAFVVLTTPERAAEFAGTVHASIDGFALTADAGHIVAPDEAAEASTRCLAGALADAGLEASDLCHINAHGTGTPKNDVSEAKAIRQILGSHDVPVTSIKGAVGHLMGAAGAVELLSTILALRDRLAPPTVNCDNIDPEIDIDVVQFGPRQLNSGSAITCSFGFGGQNAAILVS